VKMLTYFMLSLAVRYQLKYCYGSMSCILSCIEAHLRCLFIQWLKNFVSLFIAKPCQAGILWQHLRQCRDRLIMHSSVVVHLMPELFDNPDIDVEMYGDVQLVSVQCVINRLMTACWWFGLVLTSLCTATKLLCV